MIIPGNSWQGIKRRFGLTGREIEILQLVCEGLDNDEIASALGLKRGTVETYLQTIYARTMIAGTNRRVRLLLKIINIAQANC